MKAILVKYALTPTLALSTFFTSAHYASHFYIRTESRLIEYTDSKLIAFKASIRPYIETDSIPYATPTRLDLIAKAAASHNISPYLIQAIIDIESNGKRDAERFEPTLGTRSIGLMQPLALHAGTSLCPGIHWTDLYQESANIDCGASILASALSKQKSLYKALIEYNGGATCVQRPSCFARADTYTKKVTERFAELSYQSK